MLAILDVKFTGIFTDMFARRLQPPSVSFFLFGPRATGKSTWMREHFKEAFTFDLLKNETYFRLLSSTTAFREQVLACDVRQWIVVDEIQRIPALLNEVQSLMEECHYQFALTGSSARKLKKGQANLLAGRAIVRHLYPLTFLEYGTKFPLDEILSYGTLPMILQDPKYRIDRLEAYAGTYLREEIKEEALTRNIDSFGRFLEIAALANAQVTNLSNIAREAMVSRSTATTYFEILEDTLMGSRLSGWSPKLRMKETSHPKFYFFDCGVVRAVQGRLQLPLSPEERGHLLETYLFHEIKAYIAYSGIGGRLSYWRTADGIEVDFIWQRGETVVAIEVKAGERWRAEYAKGLIALKTLKTPPQKCIVVYLGKEQLKTDWGMVMPIIPFLTALNQGEVLMEFP